jgi:hypothetical protein
VIMQRTAYNVDDVKRSSFCLLLFSLTVAYLTNHRVAIAREPYKVAISS